MNLLSFISTSLIESSKPAVQRDLSDDATSPETRVECPAPETRSRTEVLSDREREWTRPSPEPVKKVGGEEATVVDVMGFWGPWVGSVCFQSDKETKRRYT